MATKNFDTIINQINEGLFDRAKANVASAVGSIKGMGARAAGTLGAAKAAFTDDKAGLQAAAQKAASGRQMGIDAKTRSIIGSHQNKLSKAIDDFTNDLNKLKLSDPNSITKLKQDLNAQIQSAVKPPSAPAAATGTPSAGTASGAAGSTSTSSGAPSGLTTTPATSTATTAAAPSSPTLAASAAAAPAAPGAASPTIGVPSTSTPTSPATASPTTPATLANPDTVKSMDAKLKDLGNQEKILKSLLATDKRNTPKYAAQLKSIEAEKQATIKQKQAAQAALKTASMSPAAQQQQARVNTLKAQPKSGLSSVAPSLPKIYSSHIPTGLLFSELYNNLINGLKPSFKYNLLS